MVVQRVVMCDPSWLGELFRVELKEMKSNHMLLFVSVKEHFVYEQKRLGLM